MRIKTSIAQKLVNNYTQNHWEIINNSPDFTNIQDSQSVWFNINDLQDFINDITDQKADGIRIYFGEYSDDVIQDILSDPPSAAAIPNIQQYSGLHTLVMIPTRPNAAGVSCDFNPDGQGFDNPDDLCAENHGSMNPPPFYNNSTDAAQVEMNNGQLFLLSCDQNP
jgi:hypothetical protein